MTDPARVSVALGERSYDILIGHGLLERAGAHLAAHLKRLRVFVVTERTVAAAQGARLSAGLAAARIEERRLVLDPGEGTKSWTQLEAVLDWLIEQGCERDDVIVAFGGGVIGDLVGLASALMKRGAPFVQIPTTLLAQVDSSVGGKTAINSRQGKNLVGLFNQPALVLADLSALDTLGVREMQAGYAEVLKYALIDDPAFFDWLEENGGLVMGRDRTALAHAVETSVRAKARIVASDETERGARALLNLGHTFAHALERATGFSDTLLHGEAVGAGLGLAFRYSAIRKLCPADDARKVGAHLDRVGLRHDLKTLAGAPFDAEALFAHMAHDKKVRDGRLTLILAKGIGKSYIEPGADPDTLRAFLHAET